MKTRNTMAAIIMTTAIFAAPLLSFAEIVPIHTMTPQEQKQSVLDDVMALRITVSDQSDDNNLSEIIDSLNNALSPELWTDESHLNDMRGDRVFDIEQATVKDLLALMNENNTLDESVLQSYIDGLVAADRDLAEIAIRDAMNRGLDIDQAHKSLTEGDADAFSGEALQAMTDYQLAWGFAMTVH